MAKYKITAPESSYTGAFSGVEFRDGAAEVDDTNPTSAAVLNYCRGAGYTVESINEETGEPAAAEEAVTEPNEEPEGPFDPAAHGMPEVLAHLADADEAEARRVLDAEADGKNRKGIVEQRDAILARARENAPKQEETQ